MDMTEFLEWLEDIIDPHLEARKAQVEFRRFLFSMKVIHRKHI